MTSRTYYWEHTTDESRFIRSSNARAVAEIAHAQAGEVGVITRIGDGPLTVKAVGLGSSIADTARKLANTHHTWGTRPGKRVHPDQGDLPLCWSCEAKAEQTTKKEDER